MTDSVESHGSNSTVLGLIDSMLKTGQILHRVYISFGAINCIFSYFEQPEILNMQLLSRFMYHCGVGRVQVRITLRRLRFFHFPLESHWGRSVFMFNPCEHKFQSLVHLPEDLPFNFLFSAQIVQIWNQLLVFKYGKIVEVQQLNMTDPEAPTATAKTGLSREARLFSVAAYQSKLFYLSGGQFDAEKKVSVYDIRIDQWSYAPPLNQRRESHASLCAGRQVYVFGGFKNDGSIEKLTVGSDEPWKLIVQPRQITKRHQSAIFLVNNQTIAVFGGLRAGKTLNDGYLLYTKSCYIESIQGSAQDLKFRCITHTSQAGPNEHITVGEGADQKIYMVKI